MKKQILFTVMIAMFGTFFSVNANAQKRKSYRAKTEHVSGYTKKNGTHVSSYRRSRK